MQKHLTKLISSKLLLIMYDIQFVLISAVKTKASGKKFFEGKFDKSGLLFYISKS